ncbi:hypothetical protein [Nocardia macrotermitis]|uniref:Uncharacterized protein n=1 Tax=Nocardia macrotermitis TaxID=2585198 RepID=A0A7K0DGJ1_9NOCA|nr:hypothetical protein [Nocardia macrotermitis]MQY23904.1 hypothetical protein [Nocardia macrotermitis]
MGSRSEVLRLVGEVTDRYGSLDAFFARLRAEFDDQPTVQLPVLDPAAGEPKAWSQTSVDEIPTAAVEVEAAVEDSADEYDDADDEPEYAVAPQRSGMWGRLTGLMR